MKELKIYRGEEGKPLLKLIMERKTERRRTMVRDVKITVLETTFHKELAEKYGVEGLGVCPCNKPGQVYISHGGLKPEGLCDDAWLAFERFVFAMAHGTDEFFPDWIRVPRTTINCCNDGIRPVIFRLEVMDPEEKKEDA
jgi:uncharacterized repeat protein (TIGR04076 family)